MCLANDSAAQEIFEQGIVEVYPCVYVFELPGRYHKYATALHCCPVITKPLNFNTQLSCMCVFAQMLFYHHFLRLSPL